MGRSSILVKHSDVDGITAIAWFIASKGMIATSEKSTDNIYDFFIKIADKQKFPSRGQQP